MAKVKIRLRDYEVLRRPDRPEPEVREVTVEKIVEVPADTSELDGRIAELEELLAAARTMPVVDYDFNIVRDRRFQVQKIDVVAHERPPMKGRSGESIRALDYELKIGERDGLGLIKTVSAIAKPRPMMKGRTA